MRKSIKKVSIILIVFILITGGSVLAEEIESERKIEFFFEFDQPEKLRKELERIKRIENITPFFDFVEITEGEKIKGEVKIKGRVRKADSVEFYYQSPQTMLPVYLGKAQPREENFWEYLWNTNFTPNGEYYLFAKITNQYGEYESSKIKIKIENEIPRDEKKQEELKGEIEEIKQEIEKREKEIKEKKEKIVKEMSPEVKEKVEKLIEKTKESIQLESEMKKIEKEKKKQQEDIKIIQEALEKIQKIPESQKEKVKIIEEEKQKKLESQIVEKQKIEEKIASLKRELEKNKKEIKEIEKEIIEEVDKEKISDFLEEVREKEKEKIEKSEILLKDSDSDELSDEEEIRLKTDPFNPDSDNDGFLDGIEIKIGYDPLKAGPADKIIYQDPRKVLPKKSDVYQVEKVETITLPTGEVGLKFSGKGLPNSFVTLYIFTTPIVVVVKTDSNGYWEYILEKPLPDGVHRVYAALTNNNGEIEARSEAFVFVKTGEKIFRIFEFEAEAVSPVQALQKPFIVLVVAIIILAIGIALIIISILTKRKIEKI